MDELIDEVGRGPEEIRRSVVTPIVYGRDEAELKSKVEDRGIDDERAKQFGFVMGTASQIADRIGDFEDVGVQRIMFQWMELDNLDGLEDLAKAAIG